MEKNPAKDHLVKERIEKLNRLRELGINPYPYIFEKNNSASQIKTEYKEIKHGEFSKEKVSVAGRILLMRRMGKASFLTITDQTGNLQLFFKTDLLKDSYKLLKLLDLGDIIGAQGKVFRTKTGEITVEVSNFKLLTKSIRPLPEKFHGIKDIELKSRKRYLDLITSPEAKERFKTRSKIIREIRSFLDNEGFMEVETPMLQPIYGGANARPFKTHHNTLDFDFYLKISPELYLKRLLIGGFEKVYEINKNFRNEGIDAEHNPEFTMLEFYSAYDDLYKVMETTKNLILNLSEKLGKKIISFRGHKINMQKFETLSMEEALKKYADIDIPKLDKEEMEQLVHNYNLEYKGDYTKGSIMTVLFEELVEEKLIQPTFITDYPVEVSPLTKNHRQKEGFVERFELFIAGMEISNAYSELNDPLEQKRRLEEQEKNRVIDDEAHPMDKDFIEAMEYGMPPAGGVGIGIDRLIMLFTETENLRDIILFPTFKPKEPEKKEKANNKTKNKTDKPKTDKPKN